MIETLNDTYIDNLTTKTDYKIPNYFKNVFNDNSEIFGTIKFVMSLPFNLKYAALHIGFDVSL